MVGVSQFALAALSLSIPVSARRRLCAPSSASYVAPTSANLLSTAYSTATSTPEDNATATSALAQEAATGTSSVAGVFKPGVTWDICIHYPIKHDTVDDIIPKAAKVWDIDLGHAHDYPTLIPTLKKAGKFVICYFNAGARQTWDSDVDQFPAEVIGKSLSYPYEDEEAYVDIRDARVLDIMKARLDGAVAVGCDAVDPDNVDAWAQGGEDATGFNLKSSDYVTYLKNLAAYAHSIKTEEGNPLLVGQKNAPEIAEQLSSTLDFAVLEECRGTPDGGEPFCSDFQTYIEKDKPVLQIEYPPSVSESSGTLSSSDEKFYCNAEDDDKGFSKILKWASAQLDGWGQYCGGESFKTPEAEDE
ncbi:glycoside hydrolase superfamily [Thelonectria olida]|uniref:alpha-galactosidase n=1 Tax=Thelonectria olida TaxID=1576542 RepID=A0A9P9AST4_9HYPO|nr:glycoside hydrolase superfamily [Thelonectria olida]